MLHSPHSMLSPFTIFVAGIEISDEVYQDWILLILSEMEDWGANVKKVGELLRHVIRRQETEKRRVKVRDIMKEYDLKIIV